MKILKEYEYDLMKSKADSYDAVVNAVVEAGNDISAEDVTPESILDAMEPKDAADVDTTAVDELNQTIADLNSQVSALTARAETAEARVAELEALPADEPVGGKAPVSDEEGGSSLDEVNAFVKSSKDFAASVEKARAIL